MKYRLKYAVPFIGCSGFVLTSDSQGWVTIASLAGNGGSTSFQPKYYEDLFEEIKPKRVLVVEYEIVNDDISFDASRILVSETGASRYLKSYPKDCRIEERY